MTTTLQDIQKKLFEIISSPSQIKETEFDNLLELSLKLIDEFGLKFFENFICANKSNGIARNYYNILASWAKVFNNFDKLDIGYLIIFISYLLENNEKAKASVIYLNNLHILADQGYERAKLDYAKVLFKHDLYDNAGEILKKLAFSRNEEISSPRAAAKLGIIYLSKGKIDLGINILNKVALAGYVTANKILGEFWLGTLKINKKLIPNNQKSSERAIKYLTQAAKKGLPIAWYDLGEMYYKGIGVEIDQKKAIEYYKKAALLGHNAAKAALVNLYYPGYKLDLTIPGQLEFLSLVYTNPVSLMRYGIDYKQFGKLNLGICLFEGAELENDRFLRPQRLLGLSYIVPLAFENSLAEAQLYLESIANSLSREELNIILSKFTEILYSRSLNSIKEVLCKDTESNQANSKLGGVQVPPEEFVQNLRNLKNNGTNQKKLVYNYLKQLQEGNLGPKDKEDNRAVPAFLDIILADFGEKFPVLCFNLIKTVLGQEAMKAIVSFIINCEKDTYKYINRLKNLFDNVQLDEEDLKLFKDNYFDVMQEMILLAQKDNNNQLSEEKIKDEILNAILSSRKYISNNLALYLIEELFYQEDDKDKNFYILLDKSLEGAPNRKDKLEAASLLEYFVFKNLNEDEIGEYLDKINNFIGKEYSNLASNIKDYFTEIAINDYSETALLLSFTLLERKIKDSKEMAKLLTEDVVFVEDDVDESVLKYLNSIIPIIKEKDDLKGLVYSNIISQLHDAKVEDDIKTKINNSFKDSAPNVYKFIMETFEEKEQKPNYQQKITGKRKEPDTIERK